MPERLHPGVYVEEVKPAVLAIEGVSTSTAAFIGVAERGPVNRATLVTSFAEYQRLFGGHRTDSFLTYSAQNFFNNGGKKCYIVRVVGANAATADVALCGQERAALGLSADEDLLADILPAALAEPVLTLQASSPGRWGNLMDVEIQNGTRDPDNEFKIIVKYRDEIVETWDNLSLSLGDENYIENLLGGEQSQYLRATRIATATSDTPGVLISEVLDGPAQDLTGVTDSPVMDITLSGVTVKKIQLTKAGKNTGPLVAAEIEAKVRAAAPGSASAEVKRAFTEFQCIFVAEPTAHYVLISGSDAEPRTLAIPPATTNPTGETDVRARLKLDTGNGAVSITGQAIQRGSSRSRNEPATVIRGNRNLSFNLNRDGFQTVQLDSGLSGGDAVATNIRDKVRAIQGQRKDSLNQNAYAGFEAVYTAYYELTFGETAGPAGKFTFVASPTPAQDWGADTQLRLRAATVGSETLYAGNPTGPLNLTAGLTPRLRTIISGSADGFRPAADLSEMSDGELRLQITPPTGPAINIDLAFPNAGPTTGEAIAAAIQAAVRAKTSAPALNPAIQAALGEFTARYVAYYTLTSGDVRTTDAAGNPAGPLSSVEVLPAPNGDIAPALKLGLVNGGREQHGAAMLRPLNGEYNLGDNTPGGAVYHVTAGADGDKPTDTDYVGDGVRTGFNALDKITDVNLVAVPGVGSKQVVSAGFGYCANRTLLDCFFIADLGGAPPVDVIMFRGDVPFVTEVTQARDYVRALPTKNDYGAIYFPWLEAPDPIGKGKNPKRMLPPSGYVAGMYARIDNQRGVFKAPAGTEANLNGALNVAAKIDDVQQDFLNPIGINVIRAFPASGIVIWGTRTLSSDSAWRYVPVRRMAIFLRVSIYNGIQWAVFEPNDDDLWASLRLTVGAFMLTQFRAGAFQGTSPKESFFVKCDGTTTIQADIDNGVVNILVGFAPLKPAEFVVLKLSQKAGPPAS